MANAFQNIEKSYIAYTEKFDLFMEKISSMVNKVLGGIIVLGACFTLASGLFSRELNSYDLLQRQQTEAISALGNRALTIENHLQLKKE